MPYIDLQRNLLIATLEIGFANGGVKLGLKNADDWEYALPDNVNKDGILLDIKNWSLDQSYITDEGIFIQTAFGEEENSKMFSFDDVIQVISFDNQLLYQKVIMFENQKPKEVKKPDNGSFKTKKVKPYDENSDGVVYSMKKMKELNGSFKKKKK